MRSNLSWEQRRRIADPPTRAFLVARGRAGYGWLSVNRYGAICLNANSVFFGDIDCQTDPGLRRPRQQLVDPDEAHSRIDDIADQHNLRFRIYETYAGLRLIETTRLHRAISDETISLLQQLGCDRAFIRLTKKDNTFRSRLTPKPWRAEPRLVNFHWRDLEPNEYLKNPRWAIARYLRTAGAPPDELHPEIAHIVDLHDRYCQTDNDDLPLA